MFTESDRVQIRQFLGYAALFLQADPRLELAITTVQSIADGGSRPDSSTETQIKAIVTDLQTIELRLKDLWIQAQAGAVDEVKVSPARGMAMLRMEGRRCVHKLARCLDTYPRSDIFSSATPDPGGYPFPAGGHTWW